MEPIHIFSLIPIPESGKEGIVHHDGAFTSWKTALQALNVAVLLCAVSSRHSHTNVRKILLAC